MKAQSQPASGRPGSWRLDMQYSGNNSKVRSTRSIGHSIAVLLTSPSPWAAWPSPTEKSAPRTGNRQVQCAPGHEFPAIEIATQMRGGHDGCHPGSSGGIPMTPMERA